MRFCVYIFFETVVVLVLLTVLYFHILTFQMCMFCCKGLGLEVVEEWLKTDIVGCLQKFFIECQKGDFLKDPEVLSPPKHAHRWCVAANCVLCACVQIRNLWEILSGQHRNNAGDEFVNGVKAKEVGGCSRQDTVPNILS